MLRGSIPPTGIPLPFVSAGGTSLLVFLSAIGIVLAVDRQSRREVNFSKSDVMKQNFTR
ncbi:MAG: FtsW/RodA/SpoVE family cell cycle protein [Clostridia bacterium]|nr:FtsW/RodA/SpoVE family cell cycle protein [Clostridia bacterium]